MAENELDELIWAYTVYIEIDNLHKIRLYIPDLLFLGIFPDSQQLLINEAVLLLHNLKHGHESILIMRNIGFIHQNILELEPNILNNMPHKLSQQFLLFFPQLLSLLNGKLSYRGSGDHIRVSDLIFADYGFSFLYLICTQFYCLADL